MKQAVTYCLILVLVSLSLVLFIAGAAYAGAFCNCERPCSPFTNPACYDWPAPWADGKSDLASPSLQRPDLACLARYPVQRPRTYKDDHLQYVLMPIGGLGTGTIWLDGQGRLAVWQIFNNYNEGRLPDSFFALQAKVEGKPAITRILQTIPDYGFAPMQALTFEGGYPVAKLDFSDDQLPVKVQLEAFNPFIPGDAADSALPVALFRWTVRNRAATPVKVSLLGSLRNAVGSLGQDTVARPFTGYGGNRNTFKRAGKLALCVMDQPARRIEPGIIRVRTATGRQILHRRLLWLKANALTIPPADTFAAKSRNFVAKVLSKGGVLVLSEVKESWFKQLAAAQQVPGLEVFEDFEGPDYAGWTSTGDAFGSGPSHGAQGVQTLTGFFDQGLVNTYLASDVPQGTLTSSTFELKHPYIGFLIGGGYHPGLTCVNLLVEGKVVRTATGKNTDLLEPVVWDVRPWLHKQARLELVDKFTGGWGHVDVDEIVFADASPLPYLSTGPALHSLGHYLEAAAFAGATSVPTPASIRPAPGLSLSGITPWRAGSVLRLPHGVPKGWRVLAFTDRQLPALLEKQQGDTKLYLALAEGLPASWVQALLENSGFCNCAKGEYLVTAAPEYGTMALACDDASAACLHWQDLNRLREFFDQGTAGQEPASFTSKAGATCNSALVSTFTLPPHTSRTLTYLITWSFPNVERYLHQGNLYSRRFKDAASVAHYVGAHLDALWENTLLWHDTFYQSNLPAEWLDAASVQPVVIRGPTCWWSEDGYFAGYEGSYRCCPLNCTHVWNYAQTHARLFPLLDRNMRVSDLLVYLHPTGETSHRQHGPHPAFLDGQAAAINAACRAWETSPDDAFLQDIWPKVKLALNWLIERLDPDHDGVPQGAQPNTYDCAVSGANTFIGSQYLAALAAGEKLAREVHDFASADAWRKIRLEGARKQDELLWTGEYYKQIPDEKDTLDYATGCHSDQLVGQWWALQLGLGHLYPVERTRKVYESILKYNFHRDFYGIKQVPRRYLKDWESGLQNCTWPHGGRPARSTLYSDEVWTSIEYEVAAGMIYEDQLDSACTLVRAARRRYDGRRRDGVNSGPGGNPFCELECGKFYVRPMDAWSLIIAAQGFLLEGPHGLIGFKPHWQPENHRSVFTAPEGWGLFVQKRASGLQTERLEVRYGKLKVKTLVFELPAGAHLKSVKLTASGKRCKCTFSQSGREVRLKLARPVIISAPHTLQAELAF